MTNLLITEVILPGYVFGFRNKNSVQRACEDFLDVLSPGGAGDYLPPSSLTKRGEQRHPVSGVCCSRTCHGASFVGIAFIEPLLKRTREKLWHFFQSFN